ncbi:PAS domain-containing protein [Candidatus Gracilibacteria bacterium]|nr:PAS domain-containing protein [Candidatus Gracilibacteria bacterium]
MADASPDIIYVYDLDADRNIFCNRALFDLVGYTPEEAQALGAELLPRLVYVEDATHVFAMRMRYPLMGDAAIDELEYRLCGRDGALRWMLGREVVFARNDRGEPSQILGVARDITHQKEAQLASERREALLRTISDTLPDGYLYQAVQRRDGSYIGFNYVSAGVERLLGITPAAVLADVAVLLQATAPDDRAWVRAADRESCRTLSLFDVEMRVRKADGSYGWFHNRAVPQLLPEGLILWNGVSMEITARKEADLALVEANALLRQRLSELATLNQIAQTLTVWTDLPEGLRAIGPTLLQLFNAERVLIWSRASEGTAFERLALADAAGVHLEVARVDLSVSAAARRAVLRRAAVLLNDQDFDPIAGESAPTNEQQAGGGMVLPLIASGTLIGLLALRGAAGKTTYSPSEIELAQTVSGLLAGAIDNARLFRQSLAASVEAERRRLARELHDSVIQSLYSLNLLAAGWAALIAKGRAGDVQAWFGQVESIALQALKEMRLLIHQLRPPELDRLGFVGALRERLDAVEGRAQMRTHLSARGPVEEIDRLQTPQLFGAAQEALNNVLRHSRATDVAVDVQVDVDHVAGRRSAINGPGASIPVFIPPGWVGARCANVSSRSVACWSFPARRVRERRSSCALLPRRRRKRRRGCYHLCAASEVRDESGSDPCFSRRRSPDRAARLTYAVAGPRRFRFSGRGTRWRRGRLARRSNTARCSAARSGDATTRWYCRPPFDPQGPPKRPRAGAHERDRGRYGNCGDGERRCRLRD